MPRMKQPSKLTLSAEELSLVCDGKWILTKHAVIDKLYEMFGHLSEKYSEIASLIELPPNVTGALAKISRGENYRKLPYVMLDYPRCFEGDNVFAIRTMFWWGNFFSITLQLSGEYKKMQEQNLLASFEELKQSGFYLCISDDPWQHHFGEDNYQPLHRLSTDEFNRLIAKKKFVKLALNYPLNRWGEVSEMLVERFTQIVRLLKS